jgi:hypothetical protein
MWDVRWHGILKRAAIYPDLFKIGMHLYGPDGVSKELEAYVKTCEHIGIKPIEVVATEFGLDAVADSKLNGNRSRGIIGKTYATWMSVAANGELAPFIKSGVLVGACVFTWSRHPDWVNFDVEFDTDWQDAICAVTVPEKETVLQLHPFPADFATRSKQRYVKASTSQFIRLDPQRAAVSGGIITSKQIHCDVILPEDLKMDERKSEIINGVACQWVPIKTDSGSGWVCWELLKFDTTPEKVVTGEIPVVIPPKPTELTLKPRQLVIEFDATDPDWLLIKPTADAFATAFRTFLKTFATTELQKT